MHPAPYRPIDFKITGTVSKLLDEQSGEGKNVPASDLRIGLTFALTICA